MDGAIHPATTQQRLIRGVYDGIDLQTGDIADLDSQFTHTQ